MNLVFCLSDPLDTHNRASGYSICYNGSGFLNLMANSSGQKMNLKCPCFSFPMPILTKLVPSRFCKYCDFTKIVKFFIKSLEVPKKKQAWILKKMYKRLPLSIPEKEWAEYCFFELNLGHISLVVTSRTYFLDCQHYVNVKESISLSIYLYFMYIILCFLKNVISTQY